MRVLVVHNRYRSAQPSGENVAVDDHLALLRRAGVEVSCYERQSDEIARFSAAARAALPVRAVWSIEDVRRLRVAVRLRRPDVVHVHNTFPLISPAVISSCAHEGVPVVVTFHNYRSVCANSLLLRGGAPCELCVGHSPWAAVRHACYRGSRAATLPIAVGIALHRHFDTWRHAAALIALSHFAREKLVAGGLPGDRMHVISNAVERDEVGRSGAGDYILYLGRLSEEKGVDLLAAAWPGVPGRLVVAGDGPRRGELEARLANGDPPVTFLGSVVRAEARKLLHGARALVIASRVYECSPIVLAEAYAAGVPVIAPRHGAFAEFVDDQASGLLFEPGNALDLARCLRQLARDDADALRLGSGAAERFERTFAPQIQAEKLLQLYRTVGNATQVGEPVMAEVPS